MDLGLSERQRSAVAAAVTILATAVIVAAVGGLFWLIALFAQRFSNVLLPLAAAAVAALVFQPYYEWLRERQRVNKIVAIVLVFLSGIVPLALFTWFVGALVFEQILDLTQKAPAWWQDVSLRAQERWPEIKHFFEDTELGQQIRTAAEEHSGSLVDGARYVVEKVFTAGAGIARGVVALLGWVVVPVYFAFFLMADTRGIERLENMLPFLKEETRHDVVYLVDEFINIIVAFFRGQLIIAFLQGLLFAIGFSVVGLKYGFLIGLVLGFLNIIPYLGNIIGLGVAIPLALLQPGGGLVKLALVLAVFAAVQMIEGYLLTPKIMGDRTGLHPMAIIVAIFFWGSALGGLSGMILAIPLTAFLVVFWRLAREKYVQELV